LNIFCIIFDFVFYVVLLLFPYSNVLNDNMLIEKSELKKNKINIYQLLQGFILKLRGFVMLLIILTNLQQCQLGM